MEPTNEVNINPSQTPAPSNDNNSSAMTILISIIVIVIIALAFYFGFYHRGGSSVPNDINVDLNLPSAVDTGASTPAPAQ